MPSRYPHDHENDVIYFGKVNFRNQMKVFGVKTDDRRRHMYVIGKTGMGKTTLLENLILSDIYAGHGCAYIDPHGDTAEKLINHIPSWRINDVVYFNPADLQYPVGFNILENVDPEMKHLIASGLMGVFKKIWEGVWSARMEYIMNNTILALLDTPGTTLLGINRMLSDAEYRKKIILNIQDPIVKQFWVQEFGSYQDKFATEAVAPIQNKVGQFLSAGIIRNIVAQSKSTINMRDIMDNQKIFIVNLSKGRVGEDASRLLGGMLITKIQMAAMERVDTPEPERNDFYMYVDEFQNFAVESFASILSEARKYRLNLIMAHQYIAQLTEEVRDAVFGNVGTMVTFRVGSPDAQFMEDEFMPRFVPEDLINLPKFNIYLKLMIDGVTSQPFSAVTLPPIAHATDSHEKVVEQSRERYASTREKIEEKVMEWSGFHEDVDVEEKMKEVKQAKKDAKKQKYMHTYECTRCGKSFDLPVELDRSRPIYCEDCHPIIQEERKKGRTKKQEHDKKKAAGKKVVDEPPKVKEGDIVEKKVGDAISLDALRKDDKRDDSKGKTDPEKVATKSDDKKEDDHVHELKHVGKRVMTKDESEQFSKASEVGKSLEKLRVGEDRHIPSLEEVAADFEGETPKNDTKHIDSEKQEQKKTDTANTDHSENSKSNADSLAGRLDSIRSEKKDSRKIDKELENETLKQNPVSGMPKGDEQQSADVKKNETESNTEDASKKETIDGKKDDSSSNNTPDNSDKGQRDDSGQDQPKKKRRRRRRRRKKKSGDSESADQKNGSKGSESNGKSAQSMDSGSGSRMTQQSSKDKSSSSSAVPEQTEGSPQQNKQDPASDDSSRSVKPGEIISFDE